MEFHEIKSLFNSDNLCLDKQRYSFSLIFLVAYIIGIGFDLRLKMKSSQLGSSPFWKISACNLLAYSFLQNLIKRHKNTFINYSKKIRFNQSILNLEVYSYHFWSKSFPRLKIVDRAYSAP